VQGVTSAGCPTAPDLDGDYVLDLTERGPEGSRWEVAFPECCRLTEVRLESRIEPEGTHELRAWFEGDVLGPTWVATKIPSLDAPFHLGLRPDQRSHPLAGCSWPETITAAAVAAPVLGRYRISAAPAIFELQAAAASASSSGSCDLTGIDPPTATICVDTAKTFKALGSNLKGVKWSTDPEGDPATGTGPSFKTQWEDPGEMVVKATCGKVAKTATVTVTSLGFDKETYRTGFTNPPRRSNIAVKGTLECDPPATVADVTLGLIGPPRVKIEILRRDPAAGLLTFQLKGLTATPKLNPEGDTTLVARVDGKDCAEAQVVVVIPKAIHKPYPQKNGPVTPKNMWVSVDTSPALFDVPRGQVLLITAYFHTLIVTVEDQFGDILDELYEDAPVEEFIVVEELFERAWHRINQSLSAAGTYLDPVGFPARGPQVPRRDRSVLQWARQPLIPLAPGGQRQSLPVKVGGHFVGTIVRDVIETPPANIQVIWPPQNP